jgi:hypothetical protein
MAEANLNLKFAHVALQKIGFWSRLFRTKKYETAYRNFVDAIRVASAWCEHGQGTDNCRLFIADSIKKAILLLEQHPFDHRHPWQKGNLNKEAT